MSKLFNTINDNCFGSSLPNAEIIYFDANKVWTYIMLKFNFLIDGVAIPPEYHGRWIIGIAKDLTKEEKIATLIHEMVHIWQGETSRKMNHGKEFKRKTLSILEELS